MSAKPSTSIFSGLRGGRISLTALSMRGEYQDDEKEFAYVFALWYNRVLMGLLIGFLAKPQKIMTAVLRGALLGTVVSFAFFASAGFGDVVSFLAGTIYGIIIELIAFRFIK